MSTKAELVHYCHLVYQKGFVSAFDGNLSVRLSGNRILITSSALPKIEIREKDLIEIDLDGNVLSGKGKPSTEYKLHTFIYKNRTDINSVIHCHPTFTSSISITKRKINFAVFPEVVLTLGKIALCEYATPSTNEVTDSLKQYVENAFVYILKNHGAVTSGKSLRDAYYKMDKLEHFSKIIINSFNLGEINHLNKKQLSDLYSIAEKTYNIKINSKNKYI